MTSTVSRRRLLRGAGALAVAAGAVGLGAAGLGASDVTAAGDSGGVGEASTREVPFSAGTGRPTHEPPRGAVDCHMHIFDPDRFPYAIPGSPPPPKATVDDYLLLRERLGIGRAVVVTPSNYATDNGCTIDAIAQLGPTARGVAVVDETVTDEQLRAMDAGGIRGIRFNLTRPGGTGAEQIRPLAGRVADLGWHVQIHMTADGILENLDRLRDLPTDLVIDHAGRIPGPEGTAHPAFPAILGLIESGRTWVKVSGVYHESPDGPPHYADRAAVAQALVRAAPERMVWGTDWPHPTASRGEVPMPDDASMLDMLYDWAGGQDGWQRILVANPAGLYRFTDA
jgi:D-galactarolactone isomerase